MDTLSSPNNHCDIPLSSQAVQQSSSSSSSALFIRMQVQNTLCTPTYESEAAAGADLKAYIEEPILIAPGQSVLIPTGVSIEIPYGYEAQIRPRSGLAIRHSITVLNSPGTVDSDYRGQIKVILINHGNVPFEIVRGMRIAQMVIAKVEQAQFIISDELTKTQRGHSGFGHTGMH